MLILLCFRRETQIKSLQAAHELGLGVVYSLLFAMVDVRNVLGSPTWPKCQWLQITVPDGRGRDAVLSQEVRHVGLDVETVAAVHEAAPQLRRVCVLVLMRT